MHYSLRHDFGNKRCGAFTPLGAESGPACHRRVSHHEPRARHPRPQGELKRPPPSALAPGLRRPRRGAPRSVPSRPAPPGRPERSGRGPDVPRVTAAGDAQTGPAAPQRSRAPLRGCPLSLRHSAGKSNSDDEDGGGQARADEQD
ncbi:unnamed protein product [Coccothraustes coccothraustes]